MDEGSYATEVTRNLSDIFLNIHIELKESSFDAERERERESERIFANDVLLIIAHSSLCLHAIGRVYFRYREKERKKKYY